MRKIAILYTMCSAAIVIIGVPTLLTAGNGMSPVKGCGETDLMLPTAEGSATVTIGGETYDLELNVQLFGQELKGKAIHATATHVFSGAGIAFSTSDKEILTPTSIPGLYIVNSNSTVVEGGTGHLTMHGTIQMTSDTTGHAVFRINGAIRLDD